MRKMLRRVVDRVKVDSISTDDLIQEGLIHLWRLERRSPGQTLSWYLQSCRFHLLHYVNAGRSVDAWKRRRLVVSFSSQSKPNGWLTRWELQSARWPAFDARDLFAVLEKQLPPAEREVLGHLAHGLGTREIARRIGISHQAVIKRRRKIAALVIKLGRIPAKPMRTCAPSAVAGNGRHAPAPPRPSLDPFILRADTDR